MKIQVIKHNQDISELESKVFENGLLKPMPKEFYDAIDSDQVKLLMLRHGIYVLPTTELIEWLKNNIEGSAIEIGSRLGTIGRSLGIPCTDNRMQEREDIIAHYRIMNQPTINYPSDIEKLDAIDAINKYKPDTVIGAFITHKWVDKTQTGNYWGVDEHFVIKNAKYINIGNMDTHKDKPILFEFPKALSFNWLITRSAQQNLNRIWIYEKKK